MHMVGSEPAVVPQPQPHMAGGVSKPEQTSVSNNKSTNDDDNDAPTTAATTTTRSTKRAGRRSLVKQESAASTGSTSSSSSSSSSSAPRVGRPRIRPPPLRLEVVKGAAAAKKSDGVHPKQQQHQQQQQQQQQDQQHLQHHDDFGMGSISANGFPLSPTFGMGGFDMSPTNGMLHGGPLGLLSPAHLLSPSALLMGNNGAIGAAAQGEPAPGQPGASPRSIGSGRRGFTFDFDDALVAERQALGSGRGPSGTPSFLDGAAADVAAAAAFSQHNQNSHALKLEMDAKGREIEELRHQILAEQNSPLSRAGASVVVPHLPAGAGETDLFGWPASLEGLASHVDGSLQQQQQQQQQHQQHQQHQQYSQQHGHEPLTAGDPRAPPSLMMGGQTGGSLSPIPIEWNAPTLAMPAPMSSRSAPSRSPPKKRKAARAATTTAATLKHKRARPATKLAPPTFTFGSQQISPAGLSVRSAPASVVSSPYPPPPGAKPGSDPLAALRAGSSKVAGKRWTEKQDAQLRAAVARYNSSNWKAIADMVDERNHVQCLQRWKKVLQPGLIKGMWSQQEDDILLKLMNDYGTERSWTKIAEHIPGRTPKQCRERWHLNLDPSINRGPWSKFEDEILLSLHSKIGNKWAEIKRSLPGRTENGVKSRFKSIQRALNKDARFAQVRVSR